MERDERADRLHDLVRTMRGHQAMPPNEPGPPLLDLDAPHDAVLPRDAAATSRVVDEIARDPEADGEGGARALGP